jgi:carbamoyltransferase
MALSTNSSQLPLLLFTEHHQAHAASAFFPSPFKKAGVLCFDGVGEWATTSVWLGEDNHLTPQWEIDFPHFLGLLYSAFTYFTGFKVNSGEYKLMGLAPYGEPKYVQTILDHLSQGRRHFSAIVNFI